MRPHRHAVSTRGRASRFGPAHTGKRLRSAGYVLALLSGLTALVSVLRSSGYGPGLFAPKWDVARRKGERARREWEAGMAEQRELLQDLEGHVDALVAAKRPPAEVRSAIRQALGLPPALSVDAGLLTAARAVVGGLASSPRVVGCEDDPSLPHAATSREQLFIAGNLHNNEELMPHYVLYMTKLLVELGEGQAFLSVYESGSDDRTAMWVSLLGRLASQVGCPHRMIAGPGGKREGGRGRIDFLAAVRNIAMEPLYEAAERINGPAPPPRPVDYKRSIFPHPHSRDVPGVRVVSQLGRVDAADRVVFINDVFFCPGHVVRLLQHDAHLTCGMDFIRRDLASQGGDVPSRFMRWWVENKWATWRGQRWLGRVAAGWDFVVEKWASQPWVQAEFLERVSPVFYDIWVARDAVGQMFSNSAPYVEHPYSRSRIKAGLPFPAMCCWNGMVAVTARPFWEGMRFRANQEGECAAAECQLMCHDLQVSGYYKAVVDPGVRVAYDHGTQRSLYRGDASGVSGTPYKDWHGVKSAPAINWAFKPERSYVMCCPIKVGDMSVNFGDMNDPFATIGRSACHMEDIYGPLPHAIIVVNETLHPDIDL